MKALIAGCNGLLGQNLIRAGADHHHIELVGLGLEPKAVVDASLTEYHSVDMGNRQALQATIEQVKPDWILNAAAITDVDACERNPELNNRLNRDAVGWMTETGIPLVQLSTDYVFDGTSGPYVEDAPVRPLSAYGRAKLESEALTLAHSRQSLVVRTMLLWGAGQGAKKSFTAFVLETLTAGKPVKAVTDQIGNPTLANDLATAIWGLIQGRHAGVFHAAGADSMSRYDWALAVAAFHGLDGSLVLPALTADLNQAATRPLQSGLRCEKLERAIGFQPRNLHAQLEWYRDYTAQSGS